jgi:2,3-bisphosphoglycerate-dependent phosphoglycerate mutase
MKRLVLLRHGQSQWNLENRFTGWYDIDLSAQGHQESIQAGQRLRDAGLRVDMACTSVLKRAIRTLWIVLDTMDQMSVPIHCDWRLNERHYGALTGLNKAETATRYGDEQVRIWRRSFATPPPPMPRDDPRHPIHERRYRHLAADQIPDGESLQTTLARVMPCWAEVLAPALQAHETVLVVAHGNSLRALIKHLRGLDDSAIVSVEIATGRPLVFELNESLEVQRQYEPGED